MLQENLALSVIKIHTVNIVRSFCKFILYHEPGSLADGVCRFIAVAEINSCEAFCLRIFLHIFLRVNSLDFIQLLCQVIK